MFLRTKRNRARSPVIARATERQKEYARELGIEFDESINRKEMSRLIDAAVEKRDEERYERLQQLEERESEAWSKMREEVLRELDEEDPRLKNASPKDMLDEISSRGNAAIMITFDARFIDENFKAGTEVTVRFSDELTEEDMRTAVIGLGLQYTLERARRNGMEGIQRLLEG